MNTEAMVLRIYTGESDRSGHRPLYEEIVLRAKAAGMAGATVWRSPMGFGARSHLHTAKILRLSNDLPMVVEIVDDKEKIEGFLPVVREMVKGGLVTVSPVRVVHYG